MKKLALLALLGGGAYFVYRYYGDIVQAMGITDSSDSEGDGGGLGSVFTGVSDLVAGLGIDFIGDEMQPSQNYIGLLPLLENQEKKGFVNGRWYKHKDPKGLWTIAWGHYIQAGENFDNGLTDAEAWALMLKDLKQANISRLLIKPVKQNELDAMIDFTYNAGRGTFNKKIKNAFNSGGIMAALNAMQAHYKLQGLGGLLNRFEVQKNMALNGVYRKHY